MSSKFCGTLSTHQHSNRWGGTPKNTTLFQSQFCRHLGQRGKRQRREWCHWKAWQVVRRVVLLDEDIGRDISTQHVALSTARPHVKKKQQHLSISQVSSQSSPLAARSVRATLHTSLLLPELEWRHASFSRLIQLYTVSCPLHPRLDYRYIMFAFGHLQQVSLVIVCG